MQASIIIPTRNRPHMLARCLQSLLKDAPLQTDCEIIVCDDSEGDETRALLIADFPDVHWHRGPHDGPGSNRNEGATRAQGKWLIFIDDDCIPQPGFLSAYLEAIRKSGNDMNTYLVGPTRRENDAPNSASYECPYYVEPAGVPPSCNFAISRALFLKTGGFDARYKIAFEDIEFFSRLMHMGVTFDFITEAAVEHPLRPLPSASVLANRWESRVTSALDLGAKPIQLLWMLPKHVAGVILARMKDCPLTPEDKHVRGIYFKEFLFVLWRLPGWLIRQSRHVRSTFWADAAASGNVPRHFGL